MEASALSNSAAMARPEGVPDILLDGDRLNMLLDIICTDYITASYASRENGKKVVFKALQKLYLSVYASAPSLATNVREATFIERCRLFYGELVIEFERKRHEQFTEMTAALNASSQSLSPSMPIADDVVVKETLKPKLIQFVEEVVKERDRQVRAAPHLHREHAVLLARAQQPSSSQLLPPRSSQAPTSTTASASFVPGTGSGAVPLQSDALPASTWQSGEIRMEGWLRKKGQHVNLWRDRYFMIRSTPNGLHYLCYFRKKGEKEPRGWYVLGPGTTVDEVRESPSKIETKPLFTFRIRHLTHGTDDADDAAAAAPTSASSHQLVDNSPTVNSSQLLLPQTSRATGASFEVPTSPDCASGSGDYDFDPRSMKKSNSRKFRSRATAAAVAATAATAIVLTGGAAGVAFGMGMGMSAAAAASAGAAGTIIVQNRNKGPIALAAESLETAVWWRNSIMECIAQAEEQWKRYLNWYMDKDHEIQQQNSDNSLPLSDDEGTASSKGLRKNAPNVALGKPPLTTSLSIGSITPVSRSGSQKTKGRPRAGSYGSLPRSIAKTFRTSATFSQETSWRLYDFSSKLRVDVEKSQLHSAVVAKNGPPPALRTSIKVMASPKKVFDLLMNTDSSFYKLNHVIQEARVLEENKGDHSDVIYWKLAPTYLWPVHVEARDLCLLRYWRMEQDASYFICFQSTTHATCPTANTSKPVRGTVLGGGFIISPRVHADEHFEECWVTLTIQVNPKGWIDSSLARSWYYMHAYGVYFLEMITAFTAPSADSDATPRHFAIGGTESHDPGNLQWKVSLSQLIVSEVQHPLLEEYRTDLSLKHLLAPKYWSEPNATSFLVRGPQYFSSRTKMRAAPQAFRLIGVELLKSQGHEKIRRFGLSSFEQQGLYIGSGKSDDAPLIFIINFMIPGPPNLSLVIYFTPENPAELKKNSAFADLCHDFFRGPSDEYRTKRLKLIPRIVQGTWPIREGVGSTPAILGTKVNHSYHRGTQFLEIDYDIASSTVASGIVKMISGYARDLVIDLAFVIEAQSSLELPERVLGCVRLDGIDLRHAIPYTAPKNPANSKTGGRSV